MKTSELTGAALDWAVAKCEGVPVEDPGFVWAIGHFAHQYGAEWSLSGPIIERERISIIRCDVDYQNFPDAWMAERGANSYTESTEHQQHEPMLQFYVDNDGSSFTKDGPFYGPTPLIAAMRCYVASKLGDEVEIPEGLR